ncbi:MAG: RtcB family protein [Ruminococcus sp.]|jgi:RNA-splicing ligase RtcB|nr:RtcB family protein [Ruminococcus sp.]
MIEIYGAYSTAKVFTDNVEETAISQIQQLCNQPFVKDCKIRIMPDVHSGVGCVIGFTANLGEMIIPNIVGVDIGCGMLTVELGNTEIDFEKLDNTIIEYVPSGKNTHEGRIVRFPQLQDLHCYRSLKDTRRLERSIGTLGGGNHFIEVDVDDDNCKYLVIHTGSRNLGTQVALFYQNMAYDIRCGKDKLFETQKKLIEDYKAQGRRSEIQNAIKELKRVFKAKTTDIPKELCYLTGEYRQKYLDDMRICQQFAVLNRETIANIILQKMFGKALSDFEHFQTIHNYIDLESNIVRKGAVSAKNGEKLLIPINMRDGSLICIGKGNEDWNCSAPHGAGRLMSRTTAFESLSLDEFQKQMQGIYSTSVTERTLDESPMAYKNKDEIVLNISPTAEIVKTIKPVYNFKASE